MELFQSESDLGGFWGVLEGKLTGAIALSTNLLFLACKKRDDF